MDYRFLQTETGDFLEARSSDLSLESCSFDSEDIVFGT
jgi:hypothetical protein